MSKGTALVGRQGALQRIFGMQAAEQVPRMPLCPASLYLLRAQLAHSQTLPVLQEPPAVRDESWKRDAVRAIQTVAKLQSAAAFLEPVREEQVCLECLCTA